MTLEHLLDILVNRTTWATRALERGFVSEWTRQRDLASDAELSILQDFNRPCYVSPSDAPFLPVVPFGEGD